MRLNTRLIGPGILGGTLLALSISALPEDQRRLESTMWQDYCQGVAQWQREANRTTRTPRTAARPLMAPA